VLEFELLRSDGIRLRCSPTDNADWFTATLGGLGLTGLVTMATLQLRRVASQWMRSESHRLYGLSDFFSLSAALNRDYEYTVAWIDCVAKGNVLGRGIFTCADHAPALARAAPPTNRRTLAMPFTPPFSLINPISLRLFNQLYFHRQSAKPRQATVHYDSFFYPLDGIRDWNRMYGPTGFVQYQCVVPPTISEDAITELVKQIAASGTGSFLAVLKQFGNRPSLGMLSFPRAGTTLALDFPIAGQTTFRLLDRLDSIVANAGGAVYPAKDARMSGEHFRQYFPRWETFHSFIDPAMSSSFWRRVME
jgi:FAD/FMN-containing dehydrogenase